MISQLHRLLLELIPGGAKKDLSAAQGRALLAKVRPRHEAGKARRRVAGELISDLDRIYQRKKAADRELRELLKATGSGLTQLNGIGPSGAARLLVEAGDVTPVPDQAPLRILDRHRPDRRIFRTAGPPPAIARGGNRQINRTLHIMAIVQLRNPTEGRTCYDRKVAADKTPMEAMRCLKPMLSDIVYHQMVIDARATRTDPGGLGDDSAIQRDRPDPGDRFFG